MGAVYSKESRVSTADKFVILWGLLAVGMLLYKLQKEAP